MVNSGLEYNKKNTFSLKKCFVLLLYISLSFLLFFFVRDVENSQDYDNYLSWYFSSIKESSTGSVLSIKDPAFYFFSNFSALFDGGVYFVIIIFVSISIFSKVFLIAKFDTAIIATFSLLYFCKFFFTLELTQFRAAAAIGLSLVSLSFYMDRKFFSSFFILLISLCFHLSAFLIVLTIPILFLVKKDKYEKTIVLLFVFLMLLGIMFPMDLSFFVFLPVIGERLVPYFDASYKVVALSLLNSYLLIKITLYTLYVLWFYIWRDEKVKSMNRYYLQLFFCFSCLGTFFFIFFRLNDSIALRLSEFFSVFDLLFFAFLSKVFSKESKVYFRFFLLFLSCAFLYSSMNLIT